MNSFEEDKEEFFINKEEDSFEDIIDNENDLD